MNECLWRPPQCDKLPNYPINQRRPLGKTRIRLVKFLKEGKAARDIIIIMCVFVLCYLTTWILGCYRAFWGEPSAKAILAIRCFYVRGMVWNPIISVLHSNKTSFGKQ